MTDQNVGRLEFDGHEPRRCLQVIDIGREVGVGEASLAVAQPGEVKTQNGDSPRGQGATDMAYRLQVPAAGEAVGEEGVGDGRATFGLLELSGQLLPGGVFKQQFFRQAVLVFRVGTFLGR